MSGWCSWLRKAYQQFLGMVYWWDIPIYFSNHTNFKNPLMLEIIQTEEKMNKIFLLCDFDSCNFRNRKEGILLVYNKSAKLLEVRGFLLCVSCRTSDWGEARRDFYLWWFAFNHKGRRLCCRAGGSRQSWFGEQACLTAFHFPLLELHVDRFPIAS